MIVSPTEGEHYYLRLPRSHVCGPTSFEELVHINGHHLSYSRDIDIQLGILESDTYSVDTLEKASNFQKAPF